MGFEGIIFDEAFEIAKKNLENKNIVISQIVELEDSWVFCGVNKKGQSMYPAPSCRIYQKNGNIVPFSVPPTENLDLIESGRIIYKNIFLFKDELLDKFKNGKTYKFTPPKQIDEKTFEVGFWTYDDCVFYTIGQIINGKIIKNYMDIHKKAINKDISKYSLKEVIAEFTFLRHGERFSDGLIAGYLNEGKFAKLFERYIELCYKKR